jgi:uncharacterized protein YukE
VAYDLIVQKGGIQGAIDTLRGEVAKLDQQANDLKSGDSALAAAWEGDNKTEFIALQTQFNTRQNELNEALRVFIQTTVGNLEGAGAMEAQLLASLK